MIFFFFRKRIWTVYRNDFNHTETPIEGIEFLKTPINATRGYIYGLRHRLGRLICVLRFVLVLFPFEF